MVAFKVENIFTIHYHILPILELTSIIHLFTSWNENQTCYRDFIRLKIAIKTTNYNISIITVKQFDCCFNFLVKYSSKFWTVKLITRVFFSSYVYTSEIIREGLGKLDPLNFCQKKLLPFYSLLLFILNDESSLINKIIK